MKVELWAMGKSKASWVKDASTQYHRRLQQFTAFGYEELHGIKVPKRATAKTIQNAEADYTLRRLSSSDKLFLLDERGKSMDSRKFASWLEQLQHQGGNRLIFLIGGAYGFDQRLYERATGMVRLSAMTISHQLVRVLALEQLYRAYSILNNHPYHND